SRCGRAVAAALAPAARSAEVGEALEGGHAIAPPEPVHPGDAEAEVAPHHDRPPRGRIEDRREDGKGPHSIRREAVARNLRVAKIEPIRRIASRRGSWVWPARCAGAGRASRAHLLRGVAARRGRAWNAGALAW